MGIGRGSLTGDDVVYNLITRLNPFIKFFWIEVLTAAFLNYSAESFNAVLFSVADEPMSFVLCESRIVSNKFRNCFVYHLSVSMFV